MTKRRFNRDSLARWYAKRHLKTDPATETVYYLPAGTPEREIRFLEVNSLIAERDKGPLEPIDFGVDVHNGEGHTLMVLDVTPRQWDKIRKHELPLPTGWSLDAATGRGRQLLKVIDVAVGGFSEYA